MPNVTVSPAFLSDLDDKAFTLLPHVYAYDQQRQTIGMVLYDEKPDWTYEQLKWELDIHCANGDNKAILKLDRELERIEKGIDLVRDVSDFPQPDWIVEGIVVRNGLTLLYGDSGAGKTTFCLYMTDAIRMGKDLFGLKCKPGRVIFIENDESAELLKSHRDKVGLPKKLDIANTDIAWDAGAKKFNHEFEEILYYYKPDVVIIDAYTSLGIPDITRPESALVLDELRRLAKEHGCAMVIIHHTNKGGEQMGSSLHKAKMDSIVSLVNVNDIVTVTQEKVRGSKFEPKGINFDPVTLKMTDAKMTLKAQVQLLKAQGLSLNDIKAKFPTAKRNTLIKYYNSP
jgi:RecA-family ATPase